MGAAELRGLYAITPEDALLPRLSALVNLALQGGARLIQYRNKLALPAVRRLQALEMVRICHAHGARLIINDDLELALTSGADGLHLGRSDGDIGAARAALGADRLLGVSCYNDLELAAAATAAGADYLAVGSVFASITKPAAARASLEIVTETKRRFGKPVVAIGGITLHNAGAVIAAGADMVAVINDLFDAMDIAARAASFQQLFTEHK
jgi:thiamine-phosphate pyrophosphorylase